MLIYCFTDDPDYIWLDTETDLDLDIEIDA